MQFKGPLGVAQQDEEACSPPGAWEAGEQGLRVPAGLGEQPPGPTAFQRGPHLLKFILGVLGLAATPCTTPGLSTPPPPWCGEHSRSPWKGKGEHQGPRRGSHQELLSGRTASCLRPLSGGDSGHCFYKCVVAQAFSSFHYWELNPGPLHGTTSPVLFIFYLGTEFH